ncbi:hypothetical protein B7489_23740 [Vibrio alginolyticus]|uniref:DUF5677 domain-containing protein n=1 Tax=Vibrio alginolyticus TaxID=663 RepID=UPI000A1DEC0A|nr:DUF5677 domain-containing protein [Vibrio alginolyticus]EJL6785551.1 hypothetical protein [Vibrio alginolyticus]EKZ8664044.1 hypothetical protein [Vibrio alginolyticus]MCG9766634.1 DUF5677 domain-containing protein [Vibrio alginolyticus]OSP07986.1 hypothetical protein B7489_23740 [Vibrio alginolyticus]HCZ9307820.1 hypothetical protein [Vibrio alginolyticus]
MNHSNTKECIELLESNLTVAITHLSNLPYSTQSSAMLGLFREAHRETHRLLASFNDLTFSSLAVRNIFEIYLISKHISSDQKALYSWYGQSHKDSKEVRDGFIKLMEKKGLDTRELKDIQLFEDQALKQSPFESKGAFQVRNLAEKYGYLEDYLFIYKLSSKLIHPSSMKIMSYDILVENSNYQSVVLQVGAYFSNRFSTLLGAVVENA